MLPALGKKTVTYNGETFGAKMRKFEVSEDITNPEEKGLLLLPEESF